MLTVEKAFRGLEANYGLEVVSLQPRSRSEIVGLLSKDGLAMEIGQFNNHGAKNYNPATNTYALTVLPSGAKNPYHRAELQYSARNPDLVTFQETDSYEEVLLGIDMRPKVFQSRRLLNPEEQHAMLESSLIGAYVLDVFTAERLTEYTLRAPTGNGYAERVAERTDAIIEMGDYVDVIDGVNLEVFSDLH